MLHSGIDLHKRTLVINTTTADGVTVDHAKVSCDRLAVLSYFRRHPGPHRAVVEATGSCWLADLLQPAGVDMVLAHAKYLKAIAYAKVKTDAVDARTLADLLRTDLIPQAHMISPERRPLRDLMRGRLLLVEKRTSARNSMHRLLEKYNVPTVSELPALAQLHAECFHELDRLLTRQIKRLEHELVPQLVSNPDVQRLLWVPGIGKVNAFTILLEVDGIERFGSDRRFFSYCRLVPGAADTGGRHRHRVSKDGNRYLKIAFSHAAIRAIQYFPEIRVWAQKKARKKNKHIARALVAKEIARVVYYVLSSGEPFNGKFKGATLKRTKQLKWPRRASPDV
jgi:transposase